MFKSLNDFVVLDSQKILGEGAFSEVIKVKLKSDGNIYALKKIDQKKVSKEDLENLKQEIVLHRGIDHPNIIRFYGNT